MEFWCIGAGSEAWSKGSFGVVESEVSGTGSELEALFAAQLQMQDVKMLTRDQDGRAIYRNRSAID